MKILFADSFPVNHLDQLRARGSECTVAPTLDGATLADAIGGYDVLVVRSTQVTEAALDAADRLALIVRAGAGVNTIDRAGAADRGIYVCNTPGKNAIAVAELTVGLLVALDRRIPDGVADLREGRWRKKHYQAARGLAGRTLGIIGLGDIGIAVAERAHALGMDIIVQDKPGRSVEAMQHIADLGIRLVADLPILLSASDAVSIHVPAAESTKNLVSTEFLSHLAPGTFLINTSRGDVVDEAALLAAIEAKDLRVGLDVFRDEPSQGSAGFDSALVQHPNVYGTHHIGASTAQAQEAIADAVVALISDFASGIVRNCVNLGEPAAGTSTVAVRHHNRVGVLASVLGVLRSAGLNVEQMHNEVFSGGNAATATILVAGELEPDTTEALAGIADVIGVSVVDR